MNMFSEFKNTKNFLKTILKLIQVIHEYVLSAQNSNNTKKGKVSLTTFNPKFTPRGNLC